MEIWNSLRRNSKELVILKSVLWKIVLDVYKSEKNIDISHYLVSITVRGSVFFVKTNKPIINQDLNNFKGTILHIFDEKMKKLWIYLKEKEIQFI